MHNILKSLLILMLILIKNAFCQSGILILNPESDSKISEDNVLIAASLIGEMNINSGNLELLLDGINITDDAYIDKDMISCFLDNIETGEHEINIRINGEVLPLDWKFSVIEKESDINYSGRIRSSSSVDRIDNQSLNISKVAIDFKGSAYDWLTFKSKLKITSQEDQLSQPRNIYGLNFGIKEFLTLRVGDGNPRLSYYTLNGKRVRGIDTNLEIGIINFRFVQGEINRAVQGDLKKAYTYTFETDESGKQFLSLNRSGFTFQQNVTSMRFSFGRGELFQWSFNFLKAKDDTSSIKKVIDEAQILYNSTEISSIQGLDSGRLYTISELGNNIVFLDGEDWTGNGPKDNIVFGTDIGMNLFQKRLRLDGEFALSLTNNNIWGGPLSLGELDTLIDDSVDNRLSSFDLSSFPNPADYESYLIINSNLAPLVPIDINAFADDSNKIDMKDAILSMPSLAYRTRVISNFFGNYLALEYSQVGPEFNSLANPYLVRNKREWSITDKIKLLNNRLMLTLGYKYQDDDILTNMENVKTQNTALFGLNLLPGPRLPTLNVSYRSIGRNNGITEAVPLTDSTFTDNREKTKTNNMMVNTNYRFNIFWNHSLNVTYVNVEKNDEFIKDRAPNFIDPGMLTKVFNISLSTRYSSPLRTNINITKNSTELSLGPGQIAKQSFLTANFGGEYPFLKNRMIAKGALNVTSGKGNVEISWLGFRAGFRYRFLDNLSFNAIGEIRSKETNGNSSNTILARGNLDYSF